MSTDFRALCAELAAKVRHYWGYESPREVLFLLDRIDAELAEDASCEGIEADAARFRWLLDGNGYFLEEEMLCGHSPCHEDEKQRARTAIDEARRGNR